MLAWARALGEFGATITFAGNFPGTTQTMPLAVYLALETNPDEAIVLRLVLIAISFAVLVGLRDRWFGRRRRAAARCRRDPRRATIGLHLGTLDLHVELSVEPGELLALLGPNGAGKTTVLRRLAGLAADRRRSHRHRRHGRSTNPAPARSSSPSTDRSAIVFQDYLLFDHMTVLENVAFGLRARGTVDRRGPAHGARDWLDRVGLADVRRPAAPGAVGRAGPAGRARPRAGDRTTRCCCSTSRWPRSTPAPAATVRRDLRRHLATFDGMRVLVTHDPVDAYALADRVAILDAGRIVQTGTLAEVTAHPRSRYVADLVGVNLVAGERRPAACCAPRPAPTS